MTEFELEFFRTLEHVVGDRLLILPQIHVGSLIEPRVNKYYNLQMWKLAYFASDKYSLDFVLCAKDGVSPLVAIELDDWSHRKRRRKRRDRIVEGMLRSANVPLMRFTIDESREIEKVKERIRPYIFDNSGSVNQ